MSTTPYRSTPVAPVYPLVIFARKIGKNTADLESKDLRAFLRWLWRTQPHENGTAALAATLPDKNRYWLPQ